MATDRSQLPHEDRTAAEPRQDKLNDVVLHEIQQVNNSIRLYTLRIKDREKGIKFTPGQWLDVHIPTLSKAGGFTITSIPNEAVKGTRTYPRPMTYATPEKGDPIDYPFIQLAVQKSPDNPPAAWLWRQPETILGTELKVRVGGSFTWPPQGWSEERVAGIEKVVFVAGGVGINPLVSMLTDMHSKNTMPTRVEFLYSTKAALPPPENAVWKLDSADKPTKIEIEEEGPGSTGEAEAQQQLDEWMSKLEVDSESKFGLSNDSGNARDLTRHKLELTRHAAESAEDAKYNSHNLFYWSHLMWVEVEREERGFGLELYVTGTDVVRDDVRSYLNYGRIQGRDLVRALERKEGEKEVKREKTVCYVCGPPAFTDWAVEFLKKQDGMSEDRVVCEKWW